MAYTRLPHVTQQTYIAVKGALRERFEPDSKCKLYKVQFKSRRKKSEESWVDFSDDLMVLVNKAFLNLQEEAQEQLAMSKYLDHLQDLKVSFGVKQQHPRKLSKAVAALFQLLYTLHQLPHYSKQVFLSRLNYSNSLLGYGRILNDKVKLQYSS